MTEELTLLLEKHNPMGAGQDTHMYEPMTQDM